ncbi:hypothetical protein [Williamsia maris]|uniref:WXG100 family type VII secretion target n=1 Tax=Williamsia maris TaxID=72806 RepID=A0ABT1H961_9NOCA|nr:hypothetical protein [Williamsia maris]MCP2174754.1 hypothetical protein [Williamsia maris]
MADLQVADIARWDPHSLADVATDCQKLAVACSDATGQLERMPVFETWEGLGAGASKTQLRHAKLKADQYIAAAKILGGAATIAQGPVEGLRRSLDVLRSDAGQHGLRIIDSSSTVAVAVSTAGWDDDEIKELNDALTKLQDRVNKLVEEANRVDDDLAKALKNLDDKKKDSVWDLSANDVNSFVVGELVAAKTDLIGKYGLKALENVDSSLKPWLKEIDVLKVTRLGVAGNVAMMIPAIISDVGGGDSVPVAVAKEGGGVAAGIATGAAVGMAAGSVLPGPGNLVGTVAGVVIGGLVATYTSKGIGALLSDD